MYKSKTLQEAHQSTVYSNLYEDIEKCPVPERYHKLSCRLLCLLHWKWHNSALHWWKSKIITLNFPRHCQVFRLKKCKLVAR